jgi:hypothetical protein
MKFAYSAILAERAAILELIEAQRVDGPSVRWRL